MNKRFTAETQRTQRKHHSSTGSKSVFSQAGVTLLELLIAVTLVSLLSVGILTAMRVGLNALSKINQRVIANRKALGAQRVIEEEIAGLMPVTAECIGTPVKIQFFQGDPESMRFVSSYSLDDASRGYPRILELQVIPGEENHGVRLIVNEHLYTGARSAGLFCLGMMQDPALGASVPRFVPIQAGPRSFVIADKLAYCRFAYRETQPPPILARWVPRWIREEWPTGVRIDMAPLAPDPARVQVHTVIAPIHVNKLSLGVYLD
jgi:prepilin-type N-terminal cleavage/methylation domain-containing protein